MDLAMASGKQSKVNIYYQFKLFHIIYVLIQLTMELSKIIESSVGSLGKGGEYAIVEEVHVKNCTLTGTTNGARIKTWKVNIDRMWLNKLTIVATILYKILMV